MDEQAGFFPKIWNKIFKCGFLEDFKVLVLISIPLILTSLSQIFSPIISMIFCGQLGTSELAGVALANSIINMVIFVSAIGLSTACDTLFPQIFGGEDKKKMGVILQKALLISILSTFGGAAVLLYSSNLLVVLTKEPQVAKIANDYMLYYVPSILFVNITAVLVRYVQSQNIVYPIMIINGIVIALNALFHQIFMFWMGLGLIGASIALNISSFILLVLILVFIYVRKIYVGTWTAWSWECIYDWKIYLKFAIPGLFAIFIEWSNFEIGTLASAALDEVQLAILSIVNQVILVSYQFSFGIGTSANIRIGQFLGANKPENAKNAAKVSYILIAFEAICIVLFLFFGAELIVKVFERDPDVIKKGTELFNVAAFIHLFDATQGNNNGIMRAVGGQKYATIMYLVAFYCVGCPLGLCLMFLTSLKAKGFIVGALVGLSILNVFQVIYLVRLNWEKKAQEAYELSLNENKVVLESKVHPEVLDVITGDVKKESNEIRNESQLPKPMTIEESHIRTSKSFKRNLIKKLIIYAIFIAIFIASIFTRDLAKKKS